VKTVSEARQNAPPRLIFNRVLVGIDGSNESREAARQAAILADGELTLFAAYDVSAAVFGGTGTSVPGYLNEDVQRDAATDALRRAREDVAAASPTGKIVRGHPTSALISQIKREQARFSSSVLTGTAA
jgi:nucleotide-binding universal stress UspA family protein